MNDLDNSTTTAPNLNSSKTPFSFHRLLLLFPLLFLLSLTGLAQGRYLVLDKPGAVKRIRFYVGDQIAIKLKDDSHTYRDVITAVGDSEIVLMETKVPIRDIKAIVIRNENGLVQSASQILPVAGLLYFLGATFNPVLQGEDLELNRSGVIVGSAFVIASLPFRFFRKRTYRINEAHRLRTLEEY